MFVHTFIKTDSAMVFACFFHRPPIFFENIIVSLNLKLRLYFVYRASELMSNGYKFKLITYEY